jgi:hypothetical protein
MSWATHVAWESDNADKRLYSIAAGNGPRRGSNTDISVDAEGKMEIVGWIYVYEHRAQWRACVTIVQLLRRIARTVTHGHS